MHDTVLFAQGVLDHPGAGRTPHIADFQGNAKGVGWGFTFSFYFRFRTGWFQRKGRFPRALGRAGLQIRFRNRDDSHFQARFEQWCLFKLHRVRSIGSFHEHDEHLPATDAAEGEFSVL